MIICLCGLIGSGKTFFALENMQDDDELIDFDKIIKEFDVCDNAIAKQITLDLLEEAIQSDTTTWFVTAIPTKDEQALLDKAEVKYLWLYSDIPKSMRNIRHRNRFKDIENIDGIYLKNVRLQEQSMEFIKKYKVKVIR